MPQNSIAQTASQAQSFLDNPETYEQLPPFRSLPAGTSAWVMVRGEIMKVMRIETEQRFGRGGGMNLSKNAKRVDGKRSKVFVMGNALVCGGAA